MSKKIRSFVENNILIIGSMLLIIWVSYGITFPNGYTFSGGDTVQIFNFQRILKDYTYTWNPSGEGSFLEYFGYYLYYFPFYLVSSIFHISPSSQSFLYPLVFFTLSFWSFFFGLDFYKKNGDRINKNYKIILSLIYTFNSYTFYNFYYTWGFSPFLFLYVLIPVIFGATYKFFSSTEKFERNRTLAILGVFFFLSNISNGNLPFFVSLNILLLLFIILVFVYRDKNIGTGDFIKNIFLYYITYFFCIFWSVLPQILEMFRKIAIFNSGDSVFDLKQWLFWQAVGLEDVFFINNSITTFSLLGYFSIAISIFMCFFIFSDDKKLKVKIIYQTLLVSCIFLANKGIGVINSDLTWKIFNNPILSSLRSYDKTLIFLPFFFTIIIFLGTVMDSNKYKHALIMLLFLNFLSTYPFFLGGLQKRYSAGFKAGENYLNAKYSYIHRIPERYFNLADNLNERRLDSKVFGLPYSKINSFGWVNYPKWKVVGVDPTFQLLNNPIIQMNSFSAFGTWNYGEFWNEQEVTKSVWILPFSGYINSNYIIYHKDVEQKFIQQTQDKISFYENAGLISKIEENSFFNLYKVHNNYYLPHFYTPQTVITTTEDIDTLPEIVSQENYNIRSAIYLNQQEDAIKTVNSTPIIEYKKINPTKYRVILHQATGSFPLVFSESFHDGWNTYLVDYKKHPINFNESDYRILDGNEEDQANVEELKGFIEKGYISSLGDLEEKNIKHTKWENNNEVFDYNEKYKIDFISKNFQDTIQNDNLERGKFYETWLEKPIDNNENHSVVNGYANSWTINPNEICVDNPKCVKNADGTYDLELIVEFWPQRLFYIGVFVSGITFFGCLVYLVRMHTTNKCRKDV